MKLLKKKEEVSVYQPFHDKIPTQLLFQEIEALKNKFRKVEDESSVVKLDNIYEKMIAQVGKFDPKHLDHL